MASPDWVRSAAARAWAFALAVPRVRVLLDALAIAFVGRVAYVLSVRLTPGGLSYDETWFVWSGWSLLRGATPYKDFHAFKPPMVYLTNALAIAWFGLADQKFRLFFQWLSLASLLVLMVALLLRKVDRIIAACLVIVIAWFNFDPRFHDSSLNDAESIGLAFYLFGVAFLLWRGKARHVTAAIGGAFLAACVLSKEPYALCVGPTWLAFMFDDERPLDRNGVIAYVKRTLTGVGIVVGAVVVHLVASGALGAYVRMMREYEPFARTYCVTLGQFVPGKFFNEQKQNWDHISKDFVNHGATGGLLGIWVPFVAAAIATVTRRRFLHVVLAVCAFVGAFYSVTLGHCYWVHYYVLTFAGFAVLSVVGVLGLTEQFSRSRAGLRRWTAFFLAVVVYITVSPRYDAEKIAVYKAPLFGGVSPELVDFVKANTKKSDYILTTGTPGLYVYSDRLAPSGPNAFLDELLVIFPGATDEERLAPLRAELARAKPKLVYVDPEYESRRPRFMKSAVLPFLRDNGYREIRSRIWLRPDES